VRELLVLFFLRLLPFPGELDLHSQDLPHTASVRVPAGSGGGGAVQQQPQQGNRWKKIRMCARNTDEPIAPAVVVGGSPTSRRLPTHSGPWLAARHWWRCAGVGSTANPARRAARRKPDSRVDGSMTGPKRSQVVRSKRWQQGHRTRTPLSWVDLSWCIMVISQAKLRLGLCRARACLL
jgi:hypothetical protein